MYLHLLNGRKQVSTRDAKHTRPYKFSKSRVRKRPNYTILIRKPIFQSRAWKDVRPFLRNRISRSSETYTLILISTRARAWQHRTSLTTRITAARTRNFDVFPRTERNAPINPGLAIITRKIHMKFIILRASSGNPIREVLKPACERERERERDEHARGIKAKREPIHVVF